MSFFSDIHIHCLCGVDDGAENEEQMYSMVDASYADGTRTMCVTPHYHLGFFGNNEDAADEAFEKLFEYTKNKYPDLTLCRGNEIRFSGECIEWLNSGNCRTLNGTNYVLVDFLWNVSTNNILWAMRGILNSGYRPVLAHAERYVNLHRDMRELIEMRENGVIIQMDASAPLGGCGFGDKRRSRRILDRGLYDVVGSDAHDLKGRPPLLSASYKFVKDKYGNDCADSLFCHKARELLGLADEEA